MGALIKNVKKIFTSGAKAVVSGFLELIGGSMSGAINEAKGANIASATTTDIGAATGNLVHITGTTTITGLGTIQGGTERTVVFDGILILTNSANIILPGNVSITTGAGDTAIFRSEGAGVWRCISYMRYDESYTNYTPSFTGFSVNPTITAGDWRWKMLSKNTCHVIGWGTAAGTSNATTMTVTLPFTAAWSGGSGFGLQQSVMGVQNNGAHVNGSVRTRTSGSNILDCYNGIVGAAFTASGSKGVFLNFIYQIEI
jgi:uncharacterized cupin superfamily protein